MEHPRNLIIIGGGPAGLTAAIYAARAGLAPLVLAGATPGGQLMLTSEVENYPGFAEPILGPELMDRWRAQAKRYGAEIVNENVDALDAAARPFSVTAAGVAYHARAIVVATGANAKWLGLPNEQRLVGKGVHTCAACDGFMYRGKHVIVVGGGDTAMEETLTLAKIAARVTVVHRRGELRASKIMADRAQSLPNVAFRWNTAVADVLGDERVAGVTLEDVTTDAREEFPCDAVFVAIGYTPNTAFLRNTIALRENGYAVVSDHTRSSIDGIFVAGDVEDFRYRQAITAAASGCMAAMDTEKWLEMQQ